MSEITSPLPDVALDPFTYVKDREDFIYYVNERVVNENTDGYSAVCVYYPDQLGDRIQATSGINYGKFPSQALDYERSAILEHMPRKAAEYVLGHGRTGDIFNRQFLFLPSANMTEIYSPQRSLQEFLENSRAGLGALAVEAVQSAVRAFQSFDIPLGALGLYGSLQCGVTRSTSNAKMKDVDMLVKGVDYYDNVRALASESPAPDLPLPITVASDPARSLAVRRRRQIAQFAIPEVDSVHCDVRILRSTDNPNSHPDEASIEPTPVVVTGTVVDANQSLSLPFAYQISHQETGQALWVVGKHYRALGVASTGDSVDVNGLTVANDTILVSHPSEDWIRLNSVAR